MLGRVMGCLEQVFIHDGLGHPIYFETYSGHGPVGEHILGMFEKIEQAIIEVPGSRTQVNRVIVMDAVHNSVKTLRAFASQDKYHYITLLDDNQWNDRRIIKQSGRLSRYKYGEANVKEVSIELEDSTEKGYLVQTRGVRVDWDNGKTAVLLTSLPRDMVNSSEVVRSYFQRWPAQEAQFRITKSVVSIHRVAGYGKQKIEDTNALEKIRKSASKVKELRETLSEPLEQISVYEERLAKLIAQEVRIKAKCEVKEGRRIVPEHLQGKLAHYSKQIEGCIRQIKKIEKNHDKAIKSLRKHQKNWLRLQGKEQVYKADVELDQIVTFYRVSLANLFAYLIKNFLGEDAMSMMKLLHSIIHLQGTITQDNEARNIVLNYNQKDTSTMDILKKIISKINQLNIIGPHNKLMRFSLDYT